MLKIPQKGFAPIVAVLIILMIGIGVGVYLLQNKTFFAPKASNIAEKILITDFYWYYPWYGAQYIDNSGKWQPVQNINGNISLQAFRWKPIDPIPYINSHERTQGGNDDSLAKVWFKGNFERAGNAGISVMAIMARPDLPKWSTALRQMVESQKELRSEGKPYPKIMLQYDGVELWDSQSPSTGQLTGPGQDYNSIWDKTKILFDSIFSTTSPEDLADYFFTYPNNNSFPILVYRIEGNAHDFTTSDWWTTQLKKDFTQNYPGKNLYLILDDLWCNWDYGVNNSVHTKTCNGDNYYHYGGSWEGAVKSPKATPPLIFTVGPGYDRRTIENPPMLTRDREDGVYYQRNLDLAKSSGADWIILETFNFGEEGSAIDRTQEFGSKYLDLTKSFAAAFSPGSPECPSLLPGVFITSPGSNSTAYQLRADNKKYWIANPADYVKLGGKPDFSDLNSILDSCIAKYSDGGQAIPAASSNPSPTPVASCKPLPKCVTDGTCELMPSGDDWCPLPSPTPYPSTVSQSCKTDADCSNGQICQQVCTASYPATCSSSCVSKPNSSNTPETIPGETAGSPPQPAKAGDLNNDGKINIFDFNIFVQDFSSKNLRSDLNNDGAVDYGDFSKLLSVWGS